MISGSWHLISWLSSSKWWQKTAPNSRKSNATSGKLGSCCEAVWVPGTGQRLVRPNSRSQNDWNLQYYGSKQQTAATTVYFATQNTFWSLDGRNLSSHHAQPFDAKMFSKNLQLSIYLLELAPVSGFPAMTFPCLELEREKESQSQHPVLGDSTASNRDCFGGFTSLTDLVIWAIDDTPFVGEVKLCPFNHPGSYQSCLFRIISSQKKQKTTRPLNKIEPSGTFRWGQARKQVKQRTQFLLSFRLAGWEYSGHPSVSCPVERGKTMGFHICSCLRHVSSRPPKLWI